MENLKDSFPGKEQWFYIYAFVLALPSLTRFVTGEALPESSVEQAGNIHAGAHIDARCQTEIFDLNTGQNSACLAFGDGTNTYSFMNKGTTRICVACWYTGPGWSDGALCIAQAFPAGRVRDLKPSRYSIFSVNGLDLYKDLQQILKSVGARRWNLRGGPC